MTHEILLQPGEVLYHQGDTNDCGYILESGEIVLFATIDGRRVDTERRGPGSILGELSILTGKPRAVSVEAVTPARLFRIPADQILHRFGKLDPVLRACIETSISFTATFSQRASDDQGEAPLAQSTLRNSDELIALFELERDMIEGLDNGEFRMHYQPIVHLEDGQIAGFEALMRWIHPTQGFIPPDRFIAVAEMTDSISKLTDFALIETCAALARMRALNPATRSLFASINISGADMGRPEFIDFLSHTLDLHGLNPQDVKLEVTETALVPDSPHAENNLKRLKDFGCGLSIDDFGTGYSNLAYLKELPLTALKIDRAFAGDAHANAVSHSIVKMLIGLAQELDVDIVAEGLETGEDVDTLRRLGCGLAQGYFFDKPLTEEAFVDAYILPRNQQRNVA